ncbi:AI-2E family transporter [Rhodococcus triatomae]|uniref:Predicted PurR-regulated permease PerM n=1 Tax=Rhodococcus triatomae TaxID=300028 RepID=A0A1G7Z5S0_9NOCA|nr:AI-2E family transporter [Rhodococcus triatomae]QNG18118.1 AI-2E family transporter [Rhodococcus triatomae]QNG22212.1 AI-2E family transporter [Rhodococcus triatomae]SDH03935.1 Predicted PurR-regulated permease PerM [Rhodococcus triatomae]
MTGRRLRREAPPAAPVPTVRTDSGWAIPRGLIVLLGLAATVIVVAGIAAFSGVIGPVFLALMLCIAVQPIQDWCHRRAIPAWIGMVLAVSTVYLTLLGLVGAMALSVAQLASHLPQYQDTVENMVDNGRHHLEQWGVDNQRIHDTVAGLDLGRVVEALEAGVSGTLGILSNLVFVFALVLFMCFDGMSLGARMKVVAQERPEIAYALHSFAVGTRKYLVVSTVFGLIVAVCDGIALWMLGIPLPVLWALLSFITNYIPNIGFVLGLVPPALLALLEGGPWLMFWVIVVYSVINFVIQSIIQPKFVGDAVGLSVTMTFLALVFWSWVLGALGALLAIPLSLLVKSLLLDIDPATRWTGALIGGSTAPVKPAERGESDADPGSGERT